MINDAAGIDNLCVCVLPSAEDSACRRVMRDWIWGQFELVPSPWGCFCLMRSSPSDLPSLSCWFCCSFSPRLASASGSSLSSSPAEQVVLGSLDPVGLLPGTPCSLPQPLVCSSIAYLSTLPCFGFRGSQANGDGFHDTFRFLVCSCEAQIRPFLFAFLKVFLYLLISLFKKFLIYLKIKESMKMYLAAEMISGWEYVLLLQRTHLRQSTTISNSNFKGHNAFPGLHRHKAGS